MEQTVSGTERKRIMMLGGNYFQKTATLAAVREGYYVISVDYLPDNPAHKYAHEYYNISTIDREKVLEKARELHIDGIVSFASDVSAPTAACVAEALGLPTNPYESVNILTHKNLFRKFLKEHDFPVPFGETFTDREAARAFCAGAGRSMMLKPVDASGSKGVARIDSMEQFDAAWDEAMRYSLSKTVILEELIERSGYQMDGDIFVDRGEIVMWGICSQHHDMACAPYVPVGHSYPPVQEKKYQEEAAAQIRRLLWLLKLHMGAFNVEYIVDRRGRVFLMEIGPRSGGNLIADAVCEASGIDMARALVRQAVGDDAAYLKTQERNRGFVSSYIVHSQKSGIFREMKVSPVIKEKIIRSDLFIQRGDEVTEFRNAAFSIGAMLLRFDSAEEMCEMVENMNEYLEIVVE